MFTKYNLLRSILKHFTVGCNMFSFHILSWRRHTGILERIHLLSKHFFWQVSLLGSLHNAFAVICQKKHRDHNNFNFNSIKFTYWSHIKLSVNVSDEPFSPFIETTCYSDVCKPSLLIFSILSQQYIFRLDLEKEAKSVSTVFYEWLIETLM